MRAGRAPDETALAALRAARDRIDRDYAERIDLDTLAAVAGYSRSHFIRAFRLAYGETPGQFRTRRRIERACDLLRAEALSVTEVCYAVGFVSLGGFSARFRTVVGRSPSAYRRAARAGGCAPIPACYALMWRAGLKAESRASAANAAHWEKPRRAGGRTMGRASTSPGGGNG